jgi:hypothetical protein
MRCARLDPLGRHGGWSGFGKVTDLRKLWYAVERAARFQPRLAETLYPLPVSKAALEKQAGENNQRRTMIETMNENALSTRSHLPAQAILQNDIIAKALGMLGGNRYDGMFD